MNERIKELAQHAGLIAGAHDDLDFKKNLTDKEKKFAELIVLECMAIARKWEDELEKAKMPSESDAVGIATYRIARQFGVKGDV